MLILWQQRKAEGNLLKSSFGGLKFEKAKGATSISIQPDQIYESIWKGFFANIS